MPSSYKTQNLNLNNFIGTDKPKRIDFNEDNQKIDDAFGQHVADYGTHITEEERSNWNNSLYQIGVYTGNGVLRQTVNIGFTPRAVIAFLQNEALLKPVFGVSSTTVTSAIATTNGYTRGMSIKPNGFEVVEAPQPSPDGILQSMNQNGKTYCYLAFR